MMSTKSRSADAVRRTPENAEENLGPAFKLIAGKVLPLGCRARDIGANSDYIQKDQ
jgi:hypothetical protein